MRFSASLVRTSKETAAAIPPRPSHGFAWLLHADGPPRRARHSTYSLDTAMYAIRAYLLPCNHRKACRETKWTIRDRAPPANSKQISQEAPLNSGTSRMVRDGPQLKTVPFSDKRCVRTSRQDRLLCLTLIVFSLSVPKQHEGHPNSSGSTSDSRVSRLKEVLQLPDGPKQG